ncbi:hypothetical protein AMIS_54750 [Actinoplanes missouriensis 431]|uniref:Uncharacterized protein n=1 Tax=Actinoplanes missouriensis (strain ATCC 14538 / DSM 43046 / CBS 188.64 / JCM 3121 / NBRC 102363 / NCIMB 12654 / NRRL B-3342 / UNCC 431) TaxID=512565 RepID=I0HCF8_ACTM4|nr:hypothetical protein [Actinoplanes missouriensis]BAL90695.1 hypothetical protein AMIS_54750 [Actinoplanes missouriensis 431]
MFGTHLLVAATVLATGAPAPAPRGPLTAPAPLGPLTAPAPLGPLTAPASRGPLTEIAFAISPDQVTQGSRVVLAGYAGSGDSGNAAPVDVYFRKTENDPYVRIARTAAASSGRFSTTVTAVASGDYEVLYRGNKRRGPASASDYLAVYTTRTVTRLVYAWTATRLQCHPVCRTHGPELTLGTGPVHLSFQRDCGPTRSGGSLGFTRDPWNKHAAGDPGWRDFKDGAGPVEFDLAPPERNGHFYLTWSSVQRARGQATLCDLRFTATQTANEITYV